MTQIVVGGGFRGACLAAALRRRGAAVTLIEGSRALGGVLRGADWDGRPADLGCQMFTAGAPRLAQMLHEVLQGAVKSIEVQYATMTPAGRVDGVAVLDLTALADRPAAAAELIAAAARADEADATDLRERLLRRYGRTAGLAVIAAAERCARAPAQSLDPGALDSMPLGRIRLLPTAEALPLKADPRIDRCLAVPAADRPTATNRLADYPRQGGTRAFADGLRPWLEQQGVEVLTGAVVAKLAPEGGLLTLADGRELPLEQLWWTTAPEVLAGLLGDEAPPLAGHPVPLVVHDFAVPVNLIEPFTYIHDLRPGQRVYRASTPGLYGGILNQHGEAQVCAEVPTGLHEPAWTEAHSAEEAARVWEELREMGLVKGALPERRRTLRAPDSLRYPRRGAAASFDAFAARLAERNPWVCAWSQRTYAKATLLDEAEALAESAAVGRA